MGWLRRLWQRFKDWREWHASLCCCGNCSYGYALCRPPRTMRRLLRATPEGKQSEPKEAK
jgi:hypothetical protein